jgi:hypothetical protein
MQSKRLLILVAIVAIVGGYILLFERHQPTTEEVREQADKVFPGLEQDAITMIEISNSSDAIRIEKQGESWRLTDPFDFPADETAVGGLLTSLLGLKAERKLPAAEVDPAAYGLDRPSLSVTLHASEQAFPLNVGNETALGSNRAVSRGEDEIIICAGWFVSDLERGINDWRSREVVDVLASDVASIEILSADDIVHAVQVANQWQLLQPVKDLADREHIQNLISNLGSLKVEEFLDADSDLAELALSPPRHRITIVRNTGEEPTVIELGATREAADGTQQVACRRDRDLLWVNDRAQPSLGLAPILWRSTAVYPFDSWNVERIIFSADEATVAVNRETGMWQLADGGEVDNGNLSNRIAKLSQLKATAFDLIDPGTAELARIELTLSSSSQDDEEATPLIYTFKAPISEGGNLLVQVSDRDTFMGATQEDVEAIIGDLEAIRMPLVEEAENDSEEPIGEPTVSPGS